MSPLSKDQRSILLYLETCCVDHGGLVEGVRMNQDDHTAIEELKEGGLIEHFGRIPAKKLKNGWTHFAILTDVGFDLAHAARKQRSEKRGTLASELFADLKTE